MAAGHTHHHGSNERRTLLAAVLTGGFMLAELAGGFLAGSLALIADAAHMATDALALTLAWFAFRLARRPSDWRRSYGYGRFQVLVAFANGMTLFLLTVWIAIEAFGRLATPVEVLGGPMLAIALAGLGVNIAAFLVLRGADTDNLNIRGAILHVLGDLLGSVAALIAAMVILTTGWMPIDPLLSLAVCLLLLKSAWGLIRDSGHILLEGTPEGLDGRAIAADLVETVEGADEVHHVHAWSLNDDRPLVTLHVRAAAGTDPEALLGRVRARLTGTFGIGHATVQIEHGPCPDDDPDLTNRDHAHG